MTGQIRGVKLVQQIRQKLMAHDFRMSVQQVQEGHLDDGFGCFISLSSKTAYASGDSAFFLFVKDVNAGLPQSHQNIDFTPGSHLAGALEVHIVSEAPASFMSDHGQLLLNMTHIIRGLLQTPIYFSLTDNGTLPEVKGLLGAVADSFPEPVMLPVSYAGVGGVGV